MAERKNSYNRRVLDAIIKGEDPKKIKPPKRDPRDGPTESQIQQSCINWFKMQHRALWEQGVLFHIANEGIRLAGMGSRVKREGVVRGVADLCLAMPRHGYGALYIEMKRPTGRVSAEQEAWGKNMTKHGNKYVVCRSVDEFMVTINRYLAN